MLFTVDVKDDLIRSEVIAGNNQEAVFKPCRNLGFASVGICSYNSYFICILVKLGKRNLDFDCAVRLEAAIQIIVRQLEFIKYPEMLLGSFYNRIIKCIIVFVAAVFTDKGTFCVVLFN